MKVCGSGLFKKKKKVLRKNNLIAYAELLLSRSAYMVKKEMCHISYSRSNGAESPLLR